MLYYYNLFFLNATQAHSENEAVYMFLEIANYVGRATYG